MRRMTDTIRSFYSRAAQLDDPDGRKKLLAHAQRSESERAMRSAVTIAASFETLIAAPAALDANGWILNVANGTLDLEFQLLHPHEPAELLTKLAPVSYDPAAACPQWLAFLETIFAGDADLIAFVQRAVGYSLTGETREQVLFVLHGPGANGKSVFLETLRAMLGDYAQQAPPEMLLEQRPGGPRPDVARLPGARLVTAVETGEGKRLAAALVKQLTGGDMIATRRLYHDVFEFRPVFKVWLATNHRPEVSGNDEAIWRRIREIPFSVTIPAEQRDPSLTSKLRRELPGILTWALAGLNAWTSEGLGEPDAIRRATAAYRSQMDTVGAFLDDCCDLTPDSRVKTTDLYARYTRWADETGEKTTHKQRWLTDELQRRAPQLGIEYDRTRDSRGFKGLGIQLESHKR